MARTQGPGRAGSGQDDYDVIVAGSGGGALVAAYTAAKAGLRTAVLEKAEVFGGMTAYSGACLWLPGNPVTAKATDANTPEAAREYLRATVGDEAFPGAGHLLDAFVSTSGDLVEFLARDPDLSFEYVYFPDYYDAPGRVPNGRGIGPAPLPGAELGDLLPLLRPGLAADRLGLADDRATLTGGQALIGRLLLALSRLDNVDLRAGTPVESLLTSDDGGGARVTGVTVRRDGEPTRITARRGVILGAGGFEASERLRREWQGRDARWTNAPATHTGDAILAGQAIGARTAGLENGWWATSVVYPGARERDGITSLFVTGFRGGIFVNGTGRRFANEQLPYARMGQAIIDETRKSDGALPVWWIFDDRFRRLPALPLAEPDRDAARAAGLWHTADTVEDLAARIAVPSGELAATVRRFNGFAATGTDEDFGRGQDEFDQFFSAMFARPGKSADAGPNPCLVPVTRAPFHAVRVELGDLGTKGGLVTDPFARVLGSSGRPIVGLYAVGNTAASPTGSVYPGPGVPLGTAMTFAYRAARHLSGREVSAKGGAEPPSGA